MSNADEKLSYMMDIGCSMDLARDLLGSVDWNLESAVNNYLAITAVNPPSAPIHQVAEPIQRSPPPPLPPPPLAKGQLVLPGSRQKFRDACETAATQSQWLIVQITHKPCMFSIFSNPVLRAFIGQTFAAIDLAAEDDGGRYFAATYGIHEFPCFTIIDPVTAECMRRYETRMTADDLHRWMKDFLDSHNYDETSRTAHPTLTNIEYIPPSVEVESVDPGRIINVTVQLPNEKRVKIDIGENEPLEHLFQKIGVLLGKEGGEFKLCFALSDLNDRERKISDYGLEKALIHVRC
jgi:hypothetical protein